MKLLSEKEWLNFLKNSGFRNVKTWKCGAKKDWEGTLIILVKNNLVVPTRCHFFAENPKKRFR